MELADYCNSSKAHSPKFFRKDSNDSNKLGFDKEEGYSTIIDELTIKEFNQSIIRANNEKNMDDYSFSFDGEVETSRVRKTSNFNLTQVVDEIKLNEEDSKKGNGDSNNSNNNTSFGRGSKGGLPPQENDIEVGCNQNLSFTNSPLKTNEVHELSFNDI